jgi:hypothetical protein
MVHSLLRDRSKVHGCERAKVWYHADFSYHSPLDTLNIEIVEELNEADLFVLGSAQSAKFHAFALIRILKNW